MVKSDEDFQFEYTVSYDPKKVEEASPGIRHNKLNLKQINTLMVPEIGADGSVSYRSAMPGTIEDP